MIMYEDYGVPTGSVPSIAIPMTEPLTVGSILFGPGDRVSETISLKPFNPFSAVPNAPKVIMSPALEKQISDMHGKQKVAKHSHYFKDVSNLKTIDVYRILDLFNVTDPCLQHAVKKLLVAGGRGAGKSIDKDIQEAIDTLLRYQEIQKENNV